MTPRFVALVPLGVALVSLSGCGIFLVDHEANAIRFCERNAELLEESGIDEDRTYGEDQADFFSEEVSKTMRYAEDATREVRRTARDLSDAYDDIRDIAGDDDVPEDEITEKYAELRTQRAEMRTLCSEVLANTQGDER